MQQYVLQSVIGLGSVSPSDVYEFIHHVVGQLIKDTHLCCAFAVQAGAIICAVCTYLNGWRGPVVGCVPGERGRGGERKGRRGECFVIEVDV